MKRTAPVTLLVSALAFSSSAPRPACAQAETREGIALQNQIAELRQELQAVQQSQQGGGPSPYAPPPLPQYQQQYQPPPPAGTLSAGTLSANSGDTAAELVVRVSALEEQNRQLQGRVDDLTNQLSHQHDELAKQISDLSFKLGQGGAPTPASGTAPATQEYALPGPPPRQSPPSPPVRRTPELALREGNAALARRDYPAAATAAHEAIGGKGATAVSAQFLLARAEAGQHQYKEAAADFYQAYNHAPKSATAPVALLGVANTLIAMNDPHDACQALAKLQMEFPGASGLKSQIVSARKRASCAR